MIYFIILIVVQLADSYGAELFDKTQSLYLKDLIMIPRNMDLESATILLNKVAIPFYIISALAPLARALTDYIGKKKVLIINFLIMIVGLFICITTNNYLLFLTGNAIIAFSCSTDIQYLYIVTDMDERKRASVRGIFAAVAALAGIGVSFARKILVDDSAYSWRKLYLISVILSVIVLVLSFTLLRKDNPKQIPIVKEKTNIKTKVWLYMIPLFLWGLAVPSINFYNEPITTMMLEDTKLIEMALFVQPLVTVVITLLCGIIADRIKRLYMIYLDIGIALVGMLIFIGTGISGVVTGIAWGMMIGGYFSATNLMLLVVFEYSPASKIGRISALSAYANGAGTGLGMVLISAISHKINTRNSKIIMYIPIAVITVIILYIISRKSKDR